LYERTASVVCLASDKLLWTDKKAVLSSKHALKSIRNKNP